MPTAASTLKLPPIQVAYLHAIGAIYHLLVPEIEIPVESIEEISISPRLKEKLYILADGQKIVVTERKKVIQPSNTDGVLQMIPGADARWLSHNRIREFNEEKNTKGLHAIATEIANSWHNQFSFLQEKRDDSGGIIENGLRPPQIGGLHSIGAHWSLYNQAATIVMPTGTGKTETMLASMVAYNPGKILVIVPSKILRNQTLKKFIGLGLLRYLGTLGETAKNPIVGFVDKRPKSDEDLDIFAQCNVIIATMSAVGAEAVKEFAEKATEHIDTLIVDEAHHIAANTWTTFKEYFKEKKIIQFTATPYRRDGKLVDGKVIFNYPLYSAQKDGYFKPISFEPIYELNEADGDRAISIAAVAKLRQDRAAGLDHIMMARCDNIGRAKEIYSLYSEIASDFNPIIVHSEGENVTSELNKIFTRESRIVICVNMLGEGFDLPQLKIAAVHDTHKSLAVLLQFTGRFTRTADNSIGNATVIANIANTDVSSALERLYSEDADWNYLLSEISSQAARAHANLIDFLNQSEQLGEENNEIEISNQLLRPSLTTLIYKCTEFQPQAFHVAIASNVNVHRVWLHHESNTLYFVTRFDPLIQWTRSRDLKDRQWDLFVLHFNQDQGLLYVSSSNKDSNFERLAAAVGATQLINGDVIFRSLGNITRLIFQNVGVRKHGRRNLSFAMYTGADVVQALTITQGTGSVKSNLSGTGWENGAHITIGCSLKGRIWSRDVGTIPELIAWCKHVGTKVLDESIDTRNIIANVLIPQEVDSLPEATIISIDWPIELLRQNQERVILKKVAGAEIAILMFSIEIISTNTITNQVEFKVFNDTDDNWGIFVMTIGGEQGFRVEQTSQPQIDISIGRLNLPLATYFSNYPPIIRFVDLSELDGNLLIHPQQNEELSFPVEQMEVWDWSGVDLRKESIWKNGVERSDSIQATAARHYAQTDFDVIFNDDAAGEAADLICIKENQNDIHLVLVHCKFTSAAAPGERIKDVIEVCSQAIRSTKWKWKFKDLCLHIAGREKRLSNTSLPTRFLKGQPADLNRFIRANKIKEVKANIVIIQPGLSKNSYTGEQSMVLASAHSYLKETIGVDLEVICSA